MSYTHIIPFQRNELAVLLRAGLKQKDIAKIIGKTPSAICQELQRNSATTNTGYDARLAKENTKQRRILANQRFVKIQNNLWLRNYIIKKIKLYWSPEQISGRLKRDYPNDKNKHIGKDSIYKFTMKERI